MPFIISEMSEQDCEKVMRLERKLLGNVSINSIHGTLTSDSISYYILKDDEKIIGFFEISVIPPECELYDIAVDTPFRGRHLSDMMMEKILEICKLSGCETIYLEVNSINNVAINLYKKYGFTQYYTRKNYYGENDAILMKLELN